MKAQATTQATSKVGLIILGTIFIWIGITILGIPATTNLVGSFVLYLGIGFIAGGILAITGGILGLALR
jgi:hypothetical protein